MAKYRFTLGFDYYKYDKSSVFSNYNDRLQGRFSADMSITNTTKLKFDVFSVFLLFLGKKQSNKKKQ